LTTTLTPQIPETATLSVTDGKYTCDPINTEPSHCLALTVNAYVPTWSELFESGDNETAQSVQVAPDGNYIVGSTIATGLLVKKIDLNGVVLWATRYSDGGDDNISNLEVAADGSMIVGASTDVSGNSDFLVLKLDGSGNILWQKTFDLGGALDVVRVAHATADGGYVVVGITQSLPGGGSWIIRLDSNGNILWQNTFDGPDDDQLMDIRENLDGSFIAVGWTWSFPVVHSGGEYTGWIVKINNLGSLVWSNTYEMTVNDPVNGPGTNASGLLSKIGESVALNKSIIMGHTIVVNAGSYDEALLMQIDNTTGALDWIHNYGDGNINTDEFTDLISGGGVYLLSGYTGSFGFGGNDGLMMGVDALTGNVQSAKVYGGALNNIFYSGERANDGGIILAGRSQHPIPPPGLKQSDIWVVKTDSTGSITDPNCLGVMDVTGSFNQAVPGNTVTDVTALVAVAPSITPAVNSSLSGGAASLAKFSWCTAYYVITGNNAMTAGTTNDLTITAYDYEGNVAALYDGVKYLTFSGLTSIGVFNPIIETINFGIPTAINFTGGVSDLLASTLTAYRVETSTVHASDGTVMSQSHDGLPDGGLPLVVNATLDHYFVSATSPQTAGSPWSEVVTAQDNFGNTVPWNTSFSVTPSAHENYYTDSSLTVETASYNLVNGVANIYIKDAYAELIPGINVSDSFGKTGVSGPILVNPSIVGGGGGAGSGSGGTGAGGNGGGGGGGGGGGSTDATHGAAETTSPEKYASNEDYVTLNCLSNKVPPYTFNDTANHYAVSAIKLMSESMNSNVYIASGYNEKNGDHDYKPDQSVTRAEFLKMAMLSNCSNVMHFTGAGDIEKVYNDIPANSKDWYVDYVYTASKYGIVSGFEDGNFYPNRPVTRAEAMKILVNAQHLISAGYQPKDYFTDVKINDWFYKFISAAKENDLIYGSKNAKGEEVVRPFDSISRADTALLLVRIFRLRDYVTFNDKNAADYQYVDKNKDVQTNIFNDLGSETAPMVFVLVLALGASGVLWLVRKKQNR
jgi:uncharacterized membrane protein YgcG